jgi:hypothetical protein
MLNLLHALMKCFFFKNSSMFRKILLITRNMVYNILKLASHSILRRSKFSSTVNFIHKQGDIACRRNFATVVGTKKTYLITNYDTFYKNNIHLNSLNRHQGLCWRCGQMLNTLYPLSSPCPNNKGVCLGCCR